ncbi:MAG: dienelactone hydrolase family protein [Acidimicrobiia bacterium]
MSGLAYFIGPGKGAGPGVLLLHSWWGLNSFSKKLADRLSDEGFTVLAPDLFNEALPSDQLEAEATLHEADPNHLANATLSGAAVLAKQSSAIQVVGLGMGGSLGLWASVRLADLISGVVSIYGAQNVDFAGSRSSYQIHLAEDDSWLPADDAAFMEATMRLEMLEVEVFRYPGTEHGFFEPGPTHDSAAATQVWERTVQFLRNRADQMAGRN